MGAWSRWLQRSWYGPRPIWFFIPLSWLFAFLSALRRACFRIGIFYTASLPVPVIVVGNISVGGTGKTPFIVWLAEQLRQQGCRPGIVTRGYGGSSRYVRLVTPDSDANELGDEAVLLARRSGVPVAAGRDRATAAQMLLSRYSLDVLLSDDGLQHYALPRVFEFILLDGGRGLGNRWLLPAGPLREAPERLQRAGMVVIKDVVGGTLDLPGAAHMRLDTGTAVSLADGSRKPLSAFAGQAVHALAGIADPEQFFAALRTAGMSVEGRALPDHARFGSLDLEFPGHNPVFMTEKDAVKCRGMRLSRHWYVEASAQFDAAAAAEIVGRLKPLLRRQDG